LRPVAIFVLAIVLLPAPVHAEETVRGVVHQRFVALLNPLGMEHTLEVGARAPLGDPREILFMGAHAESGLVSYVSPVYAMHGAYVQVSPLAFLALRAELTHAQLWPLGMSGAGYYGLTAYDDDVSVSALNAERGEAAGGWSARAYATLQGLVPLGPVRLLIQDQLIVQHASLGGASHYYDMKWDLVLARQDLVLINSAVLLLEIDLEATTHLRLGAYDDVRFVPSSEYLGHQVGPLVMLTLDRPAPEVPSLSFFVRGGYYTHHVVRADELTILGGVVVDYDLGAIR